MTEPLTSNQKMILRLFLLFTAMATVLVFFGVASTAELRVSSEAKKTETISK